MKPVLGKAPSLPLSIEMGATNVYIIFLCEVLGKQSKPKK